MNIVMAVVVGSVDIVVMMVVYGGRWGGYFDLVSLC